jgi:hypothetical protein
MSSSEIPIYTDEICIVCDSKIKATYCDYTKDFHDHECCFITIDKDLYFINCGKTIYIIKPDTDTIDPNSEFNCICYDCVDLIDKKKFEIQCSQCNALYDDHLYYPNLAYGCSSTSQTFEKLDSDCKRSLDHLDIPITSYVITSGYGSMYDTAIFVLYPECSHLMASNANVCDKCIKKLITSNSIMYRA